MCVMILSFDEVLYTTSVMSKETFVFVIGILLVLVPFLGMPEAWKTTVIVVFGVILVALGYSLRRKAYLTTLDRGNGERGNDSFVETTKPLFEERI